jgi:hypothetical protein
MLLDSSPSSRVHEMMYPPPHTQPFLSTSRPNDAQAAVVRLCAGQKRPKRDLQAPA